jgi:hypothetical protein
MTPQLHACLFGRDAAMQRMAHVLAYSAYQHCPGWKIEVRAISPAPLKSAMRKASHVNNTQKILHWASCVEKASDGTPILLIDADTMIVGPLDEVWSHDFDLAYARREPGSFKYPINAGVIFLRVTAATRAFMARWCAENLRMLGDVEAHRPWHKSHGGINQATLGYMLANDLAIGVRVLELPCQQWNCEDSAWELFSDATRIVHVKSSLRDAIFERIVAHDYLRPLVKLWEQIEMASVSGPSRLAR